ncbi:type I-B CRISPR-associated protein Cas8b1/Cst1 [Cellulosilyticum sp. I15G10I2]|uniref:type I-B CRISPR-associated protein Cas8b1/Cst1 n=1 Tax=Cellulosilyticum sp. I15G10I2 TaxID=1892843 RepID=UPI00085C5DDB|nr:type I-B CRISPR-associated protein Cas8b1/Cst1 [Cellulosilyticum sp. I15G10I2]
MEKEKIKLTLGDWMWNAAVTGFINIVREENVTYSGNTVEVPISCFENFEEKYFMYFINTYERTLPWYRLVSYKNIIASYKENGYSTLNLKQLQAINNFIKDVAKKYLSSNSFKAAFELMGNKEGVEKLEKSLQKIKEPKDEATFTKTRDSIIEEVRGQFKILEEAIEHCSSTKGRRYIGAKNVIYNIIKNGWNGVCVLNPQTKIKDIYEDYKTYFVDVAREYIQNTNTKNKYNCFTCGAPIKDLKNDLSFMNQTGFDTARKPSHVWDFVNDIATCPICRLVYSCLPAGFVYIGGTGLYINANVDMKYNFKVNTHVKAEVLSQEIDSYSPKKIYAALINALKVQEVKKDKYELADVQLVRYENENYKFNLLPIATIELIRHFNKELVGDGDRKGLIGASYKEGKEIIGLHQQILNQIFNNQNLFLLINKLLHYKLSFPSNCFFHLGHIVDMLKINMQLIRNLGGMVGMDKERDYLKEAKGAGFGLRNAYIGKDPSTGKIPGISYRLLNALKTGNKNMFMDLVLNCYMYVGQAVPAIITEVLREDDELFSTIGYAFVACFIDGDKGNKGIEKNINNENRIINGGEGLVR